VHGVVLEHVRHVLRGHKRVVHRDDFDVFAQKARAHHEAADAPEAVNPDLDRLLGGLGLGIGGADSSGGAEGRGPDGL